MDDMTGPREPTRKQFEALVAEALESLPPHIAVAMENVEVVVEDEPPAEALGALARGETLSASTRAPHRPSAVRRPITACCRTRSRSTGGRSPAFSALRGR
jgi:hypothetical protein